MKSVIVMAVFLCLLSCEKETATPEALGGQDGIVGTWVEDTLRGDVKTLYRAGELDQDRYGFVIGEDGSYLERKNSGWCATPPIAYDNFEGSWTALSDSLLSITVGYWGGTMSYQIRILSVDELHLDIRYLYADNRADSR
jgi:hypothetical protein